MYRNGTLAQQMVGCAALGGARMTADDLEWDLASRGIIETDLESNPRDAKGGANAIAVRRNGAPLKLGSARRRRDDSSDDDSDGNQ